MLWIELLYVFKLFRVVKNTASSERSMSSPSMGSISTTSNTVTSKPNRSQSNPKSHAYPLLKTISRYTLLSTWSVVISLLFCIDWALNFLHTRFNQQFIWHLLLAIDILSNIICFTFGYKYSNQIYQTCCGFIDVRCRKCCSFLIYSAIDKPHQNENMMKEIQSRSPSPNNAPVDMSQTNIPEMSL